MERYFCLSAAGVGVSHLLATRWEQASRLVKAGSAVSLHLRYAVKRRRKLAFLFMLYDVMHTPLLWRRFFEAADPAKFTILVHASKRLGAKDRVTEHAS
eukprot:1250873-Amphidinium_carterae.1